MLEKGLIIEIDEKQYMIMEELLDDEKYYYANELLKNEPTDVYCVLKEVGDDSVEFVDDEEKLNFLALKFYKTLMTDYKEKEKGND